MTVVRKAFLVSCVLSLAAINLAGAQVVARQDSAALRRAALAQNIPYYLTVDGIQAAIGAIEALLKGEESVRSLQEYHAGL